MKTALLPLASLLLFLSCNNREYRSISLDEYRDKMMAAWIGQMAGVGWGGPTEFRFNGEIIPRDQVPEWRNDMINCFGQDDLYVEMTFLGSLDKYGIDCGIADAGIDFANTEYLLWGANYEGRFNLQRGIAPPASSHPRFNKGADFIDYQIEADFSGIIAPGMPNTAVRLGETFGRLMNYGDGLYAGQFVGAMYANAFFENDIRKIIEKSLESIPSQSQYAECMRDVLAWHAEEPADWQKTWRKIEDKYFENPDYQKYRAVNPGYYSPMDAKLNGAFILMGLLYGNGNPDSTIVISMRCGRDSDCNPSNAAGVLFTTLGYSALDPKFTDALRRDEKFSFTNYSFEALTDLSTRLAREFVLKNGGRIETGADGRETLHIPVEAPYVSPFEQSWAPTPFTGDSLFTPEQQARIRFYPHLKFEPLLAEWGLAGEGGFRVNFATKASDTVFLDRLGREKVMRTVSGDPGGHVVFYGDRRVTPENSLLVFHVAGEEDQPWKLQVRLGWAVVLEEVIDSSAAAGGWKEVRVDLRPYLDRNVNIQLIQESLDGRSSVGYWQGMAFRPAG
jgi:hypothetical protein